MSAVVGQDFCRVCDRRTKFERNPAAWGAGDLLLTVLTLGAWGVVKFVANEAGNPWRCSACGTPAEHSAARGVARAAAALVVTVILSVLLVWLARNHLPDLPR